MAAIVQLVGYYGAAPGTKTPLTVQRYNTAIPSQRDPGLSYACNVPPEGETYYSAWMFTGAEITGGTYSQLTNFRYGTPTTIKARWGLGSGMVQIALKAGADAGLPVASYTAPGGTSGLTCYDILDAVNGIPYYAGESCADADLYSTTNPLVFDTTVYTPESVLKVTKLVTSQLVTEDDTTFGEKDELENFVRWQEI